MIMNDEPIQDAESDIFERVGSASALAALVLGADSSAGLVVAERPGARRSATVNPARSSAAFSSWRGRGGALGRPARRARGRGLGAYRPGPRL